MEGKLPNTLRLTSEHYTHDPNSCTRSVKGQGSFAVSCRIKETTIQGIPNLILKNDTDRVDLVNLSAMDFLWTYQSIVIDNANEMSLSNSIALLRSVQISQIVCNRSAKDRISLRDMAIRLNPGTRVCYYLIEIKVSASPRCEVSSYELEMITNKSTERVPALHGFFQLCVQIDIVDVTIILHNNDSRQIMFIPVEFQINITSRSEAYIIDTIYNAQHRMQSDSVTNIDVKSDLDSVSDVTLDLKAF